jgi:hypothetical protein
MGHAVALARWIGTSRRPVTAGRVLRKADVAAAGAALGVDVPARLRTMADIRALYRPWCVAVAIGLLRVEDESVTAGPALEGWPPDDGDLLAGWLAGLRAVCAAESYPQDEDSVRLLALALLTVLNEDGAPVTGRLWRPVFEVLQVLGDRYDKWFSEAVGAADRYGGAGSEKPLAGLVALLAGFGAVASDRGRPVITVLGRWATRHLADGLAGREPVLAAREILAAAEGMSRLRRIVTVRLVEALGDDALPAWREAASARRVGPFARAVLAAWNHGPEPDAGDEDWLAVEGAAAALEDRGPDEALSRVWESMPGRTWMTASRRCGPPATRTPTHWPKPWRNSPRPACRAASTRWPSSRSR